MKLMTGKIGSQRSAEPVKVEFFPNYTGQGGQPFLQIEEEGVVGEARKGKRYWLLSFESPEEVRQLLSQAHIVHHNFYDELRLNEAKRAAGLDI